MSLITKRGDQGQTDLLFGKKIQKSHHRIETIGSIDELNATLGLIHASIQYQEGKEWIKRIQNNLISLMGLLATLPEDQEQYTQAGFSSLSDEDVLFLEEWVLNTEQKRTHSSPSIRHWVQPGQAGAMMGAWADLARTACRRAERNLWRLTSQSSLSHLYLNRLSDALWLLARTLEDTST